MGGESCCKILHTQGELWKWFLQFSDYLSWSWGCDCVCDPGMSEHMSSQLCNFWFISHFNRILVNVSKPCFPLSIIKTRIQSGWEGYCFSYPSYQKDSKYVVSQPHCMRCPSRCCPDVLEEHKTAQHLDKGDLDLQHHLEN